jgi:alkylhydroperoxidase/carboxymuconolactone decarboxylase family protein YurZ
MDGATSMNGAASDILERMRQENLPIFRWAEFFAEQDPEMLASYIDWTTRARQNREIDDKVREFITIAIDAVVSWPSPYIDVHINAAFDAGATRQELLEVVLVAGRLMGPHAMNHGLTAVDKVIREREAAGQKTPVSRESVGAGGEAA